MIRVSGFPDKKSLGVYKCKESITIYACMWYMCVFVYVCVYLSVCVFFELCKEDVVHVYNGILYGQEKRVKHYMDGPRHCPTK